MRAAVYHEFSGPISVEEVPEPSVPDDGVIVRVTASGVCRSDWHGWQGHDADIRTLPHVPGHEFAGVVVAAGSATNEFHVGMSVIVPFICACGRCEMCVAGHGNLCPTQYQPGFHGWGSFAELVAVPRADHNLITMPTTVDAATAALLGCRIGTAHRAVVHQARVAAGEWVVVHGAGGVGLAALLISKAYGAQVIVVEPDAATGAFASELGADVVVQPEGEVLLENVIVDLTSGGAHVSIDAVGARGVMRTSLRSLRRRGRHVQVGLLTHDPESVPLALLHSREIEILGSHGMPAHGYQQLLSEIERGAWDPSPLVTQRVTLLEGIELMTADHRSPGCAVVTRL